MEIRNISKLITNYYKGICFLFVPNVCNSKCSFCYLKPTFSNHVTLTDSILINTESFVRISKEMGFNEFRITGGEPLIYRNINDLFSIFKNNSVSYTLLTNGKNIENHFEYFDLNRPKKITISYHSKQHYKDIYGVDFNTKMLDKNIKDICKNNISLTISILLLQNNLNEIYSHVLGLIRLGVRSIKFIYPNEESIKLKLISDFIKTIEELNNLMDVEIRYSNIYSTTCNMIKRGFLSFLISESKLINCCNSLNDDNYIDNFKSKEYLATKLFNFYKSARVINHYPCISHVNFCPIALNN